MEQQGLKVLMPAYMEQFTCIGSACEDTCCAGWRVDIDRQTYKKYKKIKHPKLTTLVENNVARTRTNQTEETYAYIKLDENQNCPFLSTSKLCSVQESVGEQYLSLTCSSYPRNYNRVDKSIEESATLSCPEIARLALLNSDGIEFNEIFKNYQHNIRVNKTIDTTSSKDGVERSFWEIRIFIVGLLQNRKYSLVDRMILLGFFMHKLEDIKSKQDKVFEYIARFSNLLNSGELEETLKDIPTSISFQMKLLKELTEERLYLGAVNNRYKECFAEFLLGIDYRNGVTEEEIAVNYNKAHEEFYKPFFSQHEYILENYLVNHVFKNGFPFGEKSVFDEYILLVVHYSMMKLHLIGIAGFYKNGFGIDHVIKLIQSFSKAVDHNVSYLRHLKDVMHQNGYNSMAYMSILLKN